MPNLTITSEPEGPLEDLNTLVRGLSEFNHGVVPFEKGASVRLFLRDEGGAIAGGLFAEVYMGWMYVRILWISDAHRGAGHGAELMRRAEDEARTQGCHAAWVDTFSFQAPEFYQKLGYYEFGRLDDYPTGHARVFLAKQLGQD